MKPTFVTSNVPRVGSFIVSRNSSARALPPPPATTNTTLQPSAWAKKFPNANDME